MHKNQKKTIKKAFFHLLIFNFKYESGIFIDIRELLIPGRRIIMNWYQKQKKLNVEMEQDNESNSPLDEQIFVKLKKEKELENRVMEENKDMEELQMPEEIGSLIGKHTELVGDISTNENLIILGRIIGNIKCSQSIQIYGSVEGDILCHNAVIVKAEIHGSIECKDSLRISEKTVIEGDIIATALEIDCYIRGNVRAAGHICLSENSSIIGNISAETISIEQGACVQGQLQIGVKEETEKS